MTNEEKQEAAELAKRASTQAKNAAKNTGRATKKVAEPIVHSMTEEIHETAEEIHETAENAVRAAKRLDPQKLSGMAGELGMGFFALSVSIWAGTHAVNRFRGVYGLRSQFLKSAAKADHHIRPST